MERQETVEVPEVEKEECFGELLFISERRFFSSSDSLATQLYWECDESDLRRFSPQPLPPK